MEELKERYKMLPMWARLVLASIVGLIPAAYVYFDEGDALQEQLSTSQDSEEKARDKFEVARKQKANLPQLEEQLVFTEEQLVKAKKKLPDSYKIEEILQKSASIAKQVGVRMINFDPGDEVPHNDDFHFVELPIHTELDGRFAEVMGFFDKIVHLDTSIFIRKIELTRVLKKAQVSSTSQQAEQQNKTEFQLAKDNRDNVRMKATFDLVIFRGMNDAEISNPSLLPGGEIPDQAAPNKPKKGGKDKGEGDAAPADGAPTPHPTDVSLKPTGPLGPTAQRVKF